MKIETKFNIGDEVWFMHDNECISLKIFEMRIYSNAHRITINYIFNRYDREQCINEDKVFATKQELINSL